MGTPMPDLFLKDFRERAESLVPVPDLLKLQRRGTAMRRVRLAASAAVLAFAVAIGGTLVAVTSDDEQAISPAPIDPAPPRSADACDAPVNDGDPYVSVPPGCELGVQADEWAYVEPGPYFVRPFNNSLAPPGDLEVWFVVPGGGPWYWWGGGVGMAGPVGPEMKPYIRIGIIPITGVQEQRCQGAAPERVQTLPGGVLSVAQTLVASPRIKVLEAPHSVQKFGRDAARVRFTVTQSCPGDRVFALWRALGSDIYAPLGERLTWPGAPTDHVLDLWVVDVPGEQHVAVVADYTVDPPLISGDPAAFRGGARASDLAELQELLDSIRFEFTE
jgi:hypothetical protein